MKPNLVGHPGLFLLLLWYYSSLYMWLNTLIKILYKIVNMKVKMTILFAITGHLLVSFRK